MLPVNPKASAVHGIMAYSDIASLPLAPDLAVISTPPATVPALIAELGRRGTRAAVILTAGFAEGEAKVGKERAAECSPPRGRISCASSVPTASAAVPGIGLNASFAPAAILPGNIAFVTQSGAMATTVLDWALPRGIGFSAIVSLGDMADVDFGDLLDYLALDEATHAILIYAEAVTQARKFMSAARRAARIKPVIVIKGGRAEEGARAASSHTGALAGADVVYDAAFRRAGMLRVNELEELFDAAETLGAHGAAARRPAGDRHQRRRRRRAGDRPADRGRRAAGRARARHAGETRRRAAGDLGRANPVDIIGDAAAKRYAEAVGILMQDQNVDALLAIYCPTAVASAADAAQGVIGALAAPRAKKNVLACWMGEPRWRKARRAVGRAGPGLRDAGAGGARFHVSGALPPESGHAAGDAGVAGADTGRRHRTRARPDGQASATARMARSGQGIVLSCLLRHSFRAHRKRLRRQSRGRSRRPHRRAGGAENPFARHHSQIRRRRRGAQSFWCHKPSRPPPKP